jgi:hypothetical protein
MLTSLGAWPPVIVAPGALTHGQTLPYLGHQTWTPLCFHHLGCNISTRMTAVQQWPLITLLQQWPTSCGMKNTFGMSVYSIDYTFPILFKNCRTGTSISYTLFLQNTWTLFLPLLLLLLGSCRSQGKAQHIHCVVMTHWRAVTFREEKNIAKVCVLSQNDQQAGITHTLKVIFLLYYLIIH